MGWPSRCRTTTTSQGILPLTSPSTTYRRNSGFLWIHPIPFLLVPITCILGRKLQQGSLPQLRVFIRIYWVWLFNHEHSTFYFYKWKLLSFRWSSIVCLSTEFLSVIFPELWIVCFNFFLLITRKNEWGLKQGDSPGGMSAGGHNGHVPLLPHLLV